MMRPQGAHVATLCADPWTCGKPQPVATDVRAAAKKYPDSAICISREMSRVLPCVVPWSTEKTAPNSAAVFVERERKNHTPFWEAMPEAGREHIKIRTAPRVSKPSSRVSVISPAAPRPWLGLNAHEKIQNSTLDCSWRKWALCCGCCRLQIVAEAA